MPPGVVTVILTIPAVVVAGEVTMIEVLLVVAVIIAGIEPKSTAVAPVNPVPVIVTDVPPAVVPFIGEIEVTVGAVAVAALVLKLRTMPGVQVVPPSVEDHAAK